MVRALRNSSSTLGLQYLPSFSVPLQVTNEKILPSGSTRPDHPRMSIWKLPLDDSANMAAYSVGRRRSEEHTPELQSLMSISYAVFCLKKKKNKKDKQMCQYTH